MDLSKAEKVKGGILAEGEATGHAHRVSSAGAEVYDLGDGVLVLKAIETATVVHEEHGTITVPPGLYSREIVREYDHAAEESREVAD